MYASEFCLGSFYAIPIIISFQIKIIYWLILSALSKSIVETWLQISVVMWITQNL